MSAWGPASKNCNSLLIRVGNNDPTMTTLSILPNKEFTDDNMSKLSEIIASGRNTHLSSFYASGHQVSPLCLNGFGRALKVAFCNHKLFLNDLAFGSKHMGDEGVSMFCKGYDSPVGAISPDSLGIVRLDFSSKGLTSESFATIVRTFSRESMEYLNLSDNNFSNLEPINSTCDRSFSRLKSLNLARCNLQSIDICEIAKLLKNAKFESIELILSGNSVSSGSKNLSMLNNKINSLKLEGCQLCDEDVENIFADNSLIGDKLRCLDLSCNSIRSKALTCIAKAIELHKSLADLKLSQNPLTNDCVMSFATFLQENNKSLNSLDLSRTKLESVTARELLRVPKLYHLRLFDNNLGSGDFFSSPVTAKLIASSDLRTLDLCGNNAKELNTLLSTLYACYKEDNGATIKLNVLELGGNNIMESDEVWISKLKRCGLDIARDRPSQD